MAFFCIILFGLLGAGLESAEEMGYSQIKEMPETSDSDDFYKQIAREIWDVMKSRQKIRPPVGQNAFEVAMSRKLKQRVPTELPQERIKRVKRGFFSPPCHGDEEPKKLLGKNDFESGTTPRQWLRNRWDEVRGDLEDDLPEDAPLVPEGCFEARKIKKYLALDKNLTAQLKKLRGAGKGKNGKDKDKIGKHDEEDGRLQEKSPADFITEYASHRKTGCGCSLNLHGIGCACCLYFADWDMIICAGCGYLFEEAAFIVRVTVEDFTLFSWEKEIAKSAFTRYLSLFSKSLCIPHEFSVVVTGCLELSLNFVPSFDKNVSSGISACASIVGQVFLFWDVVLFSLPCWELAFDLPFLRGARRKPKMSYENNQMKLEQPVKKMLATENIKEIGKLIYQLGQMERNQSNHPRTRSLGSKMIQHFGEEPRLLKRGNATVPINWEPTDLSKLHYLVVLYTQPLPTPLTMEDLNQDAIKTIPGFRSMTLDGIDRRLPHRDPSILNLKVHASLGKSCGGVILTPDKILTLCVCIKFFYLFHKHNRKLQPEDHFDVFTLVAKDIYVTYADRSFTANQIIYELVQNPELFMKKSKCFDSIERTIGKSITDPSFTDTHLHSVVMSVTRDFKQFDKLTLVPWLDREGTRAASTPAEMTIIGMTESKYRGMFDAEGYEFDPLYAVVKVPFVACSKTSFCRKVLNPTGTMKRSVSKEFDENTQCFCAKDPGFQLCDGVVGFPVTTSEGLIGLNSIPMHCKEEGSMVTAMFSEAAIKEIDDHLSGRDALITNPPATGAPDANSAEPPALSPNPNADDRSPRPVHLSGTVVAASLSMTVASLSVLIV